jgi:hypothetical protein
MTSNKTIFNIYVNPMYIYMFIFVCIIVLFVFLNVGTLLYILALLLFLAGLMYMYFSHWKPHKKNKSSTTTIDVNKPEEVYHINNTLFSYETAPKACSAYNGRLATYDDMVKAYQAGADWCTYGWTSGQNVFFPTQQSTIDKLSSHKGLERACGHVGINGGYIEDTSQLFGVNCYGVKPDPTSDELELMKIISKIASNESTSSVEDDKNINKEKNNWLLSPFNHSKWHSYLRV